MIESRKQHEVDIFSGTDSRVICLKFTGSSLSPVLCTKIVQASSNHLECFLTYLQLRCSVCSSAGDRLTNTMFP